MAIQTDILEGMNALAATLRVKAYVEVVARHNQRGPGPHYGDTIHGLNDKVLLRSDLDSLTESMVRLMEIHRPSTEAPRTGEPVYCLGCYEASQHACLTPYPCESARAMGVPAH